MKNKEVQNNVKIFDLGNGAKSSVKMKAISNNRYILLHDEGDNHNMESVKTQDHEAPPKEASQEVVPETQPQPDSMVA